MRDKIRKFLALFFYYGHVALFLYAIINDYTKGKYKEQVVFHIVVILITYSSTQLVLKSRRNELKKAKEEADSYKYDMYQAEHQVSQLKKQLSRKEQAMTQISGIVEKQQSEIIDLGFDLKCMHQLIQEKEQEIKQLQEELQKQVNAEARSTEKQYSAEYTQTEMQDQIQAAPKRPDYLTKKQEELTHYWTCSKNEEVVGRDYEIFISYAFSLKGYVVDEWGARYNKRDMGIDLIAKKDDLTLIIQCKRWSSNSVVRENVINQLHGSTSWYRLNHPKEKNVFGVIVTSTSVSNKAKSVATDLGIILNEKKRFIPFPSVKCKVIPAEKKRGHLGKFYLPFDAEYHNIQIDASAGDLWVHTVEEAYDKGFIGLNSEIH